MIEAALPLTDQDRGALFTNLRIGRIGGSTLGKCVANWEFVTDPTRLADTAIGPGNPINPCLPTGPIEVPRRG